MTQNASYKLIAFGYQLLINIESHNKELQIALNILLQNNTNFIIFNNEMENYIIFKN